MCFPSFEWCIGWVNNVDTIKIAAEKRAIEIGMTLTSSPRLSIRRLTGWRSGCCGHQGKPNNFAWGFEDHTTERCPLHLFLWGRKEGPGGSGTLVTNGCAAKFFNGNVHGFLISMYRCAWIVYRPILLRFKLKGHHNISQ